MISYRKVSILAVSAALPLLLVAGYFGFRPEKSGALSGSSFKAGHIIDDAVFFDGDSMSESQIQSFLNSKMPDCDTSGEEEYNGTGMTRAEWTDTNNRPEPPYICLKTYTAKVYARSADAYCSGSIPSSGSTKKSAAYIIRVVSNACNVSPKVLIVTLQKEQGLVTDDWPWPSQYLKAMGYGCPDSNLPSSVDANDNGCYDDYEGFFKQMYYAARQFQRYVKEPQNYNHRVGQTSSLLSYGDSTPPCAKTNVLIKTKATAALYNYTPYQPNQAALSNLYGTGDACSYYGNRNFWRYFNDWFGTTYASYKAQNYARCCHVSSLPGVTKSITLEFKNTGDATWYDETGSEHSSAPFGIKPVMLMTSNPVARNSAFASGSWSGSDKPNRDFSAVYNSNGSTLSSNQHVVLPGQIAKYNFDIVIPVGTKPGAYREYFQPVLFQNSKAFNNPGMYIDIEVEPPKFKGQILGRTTTVDANQGQTVTSYVRIKNIGNMTWYDSEGIDDAPSGHLPTQLGTSSPLLHYHPFGYPWGGARNVASKVFEYVRNSDGSTPADPDNQHFVSPGQWASFKVDFYVPSQAKDQLRKDYFILMGREKINGSWKIIPYSGTETYLQVDVD